MPTLIQLDMVGTTPVAGSHLKIKAFKIELVADDFGYVVLEQETRVEGELLLIAACYVTVGTFARRGLSSTAKTLRSLSGVRGSEY